MERRTFLKAVFGVLAVAATSGAAAAQDLLTPDRIAAPASLPPVAEEPDAEGRRGGRGWGRRHWGWRRRRYGWRRRHWGWRRRRRYWRRRVYYRRARYW